MGISILGVEVDSVVSDLLENPHSYVSFNVGWAIKASSSVLTYVQVAMEKNAQYAFMYQGYYCQIN